MACSHCNEDSDSAQMVINKYAIIWTGTTNNQESQKVFWKKGTNPSKAYYLGRRQSWWSMSWRTLQTAGNETMNLSRILSNIGDKRVFSAVPAPHAYTTHYKEISITAPTRVVLLTVTLADPIDKLICSSISSPGTGCWIAFSPNIPSSSDWNFKNVGQHLWWSGTCYDTLPQVVLWTLFSNLASVSSEGRPFVPVDPCQLSTLLLELHQRTYRWLDLLSTADDNKQVITITPKRAFSIHQLVQYLTET